MPPSVRTNPFGYQFHLAIGTRCSLRNTLLRMLRERKAMRTVTAEHGHRAENLAGAAIPAVLPGGDYFSEEAALDAQAIMELLGSRR